ncbi:MAG: CBS domain-containing protein [Planctomycetota bacterium]|nr:MAG: CBS domain-containing protein [Planctomycetota bacterium]
MGEQKVTASRNAEELRYFMKCVLRDVEAFEKLVESRQIESGRRRIGAEQEICFVDPAWRPATISQQVLQKLDPKYFTTELGLFQAEFNLDPFGFEGKCLSEIEDQINLLLSQAQAVAMEHDARVALLGILPTMRKEDLCMENMTPVPRYKALSDAFDRMRGGVYRCRIKGPDELIIQHDNMMLEACNNSFQVHLQVDVDEFPLLYNIAQVVAAPVMAASCYSPLLFGRRLWRETRIALFQQSVDTRRDELAEREFKPRVSFGTQYVKKSPMEIFHEDIARFRSLIGLDEYEDPFEAMAAGRAPRLDALRLHNGTVYRWNRLCYGISDGVPHLRIENRVLPAGPTPVDEVANAAFWLGLMVQAPLEYGDVSRLLDFDDARANLLSACRLGIDAQFNWLDGRTWPARELVLDCLLPLAHQGLKKAKIDRNDRMRYLGLMEERMLSGQTGSQWMLKSLAEMQERGSPMERMSALTAGAFARQESRKPVHEWDLAHVEESGVWKEHYERVDAFMVTDLFTVHQDELVDLAANVMDWRNIRHVPVEDDAHRLVGLVTHRALMRFFAKVGPNDRAIPVSEVMEADPIVVGPETSTLEAIQVMRNHGISCLPVVRDDRLVGLVTEHDFMVVAAEFLEQKLRED